MTITTFDVPSLGLASPHFSTALVGITSGHMGQLVSLPLEGVDPVAHMSRGLFLRHKVAGDMMAMYARPVLAWDAPDWYALQSGRGVLEVCAVARMISTEVSASTAEAMGLKAPADGWYSPEGVEARKVRATAWRDGTWEVEGPMAMYHRAYVVRRLAEFASPWLGKTQAQALRAQARAYSKAHRALKDGGCI